MSGNGAGRGGVIEYTEFIASKRVQDKATGLETVPDLNPMLFDFQRDIVRWALRRGRAAIFADCGMGKTPMQLEWAKHVPGRVLILAPLAVAHQTIREGQKFGVDVTYARSQPQSDDGHRITVTNYQMLDRFDVSKYAGIVLDESSILKSYEGKFRNQIIESFQNCQFRLACTATPAPNDFMELGNHAEFLGAMTRTEMLSMFFVHDGGKTQKWRVKGHAEADFWRWVCSWAVMIRKPSDLGYEDGGFILPPINFHSVVVPSEPLPGYLFPVNANTMDERRGARKETVKERAEKCAEIIDGSRDQWLIWCNLNSESDALSSAIDGAVDVRGSMDDDKKESALTGFSLGEVSRMVSKPSIAGYGMNFQSCHKMAFVGLSDSYEQFYQAVRRCWRFGQTHPVDVYIITSEAEGAVVENIKRKEADAMRMAEQMVEHMKDINTEEIHGIQRTRDAYETDVVSRDLWEFRLGDCVVETKTIPDNSIDFTVFSPPFASLYTYSASERDMGNCKDDEEFAEHFGYLVKDLYRVTVPGRLLSFHCMNLPTSKTHHGYIGIRDFRGEMIRLFESHGWIFHSEVCIWKDPVTAMQRTKAIGLLHKQLVKDSCMSRQGIPDYLVTMRKPGDNPRPVAGLLTEFIGDPSRFQPEGNLSIDIWQKYASPIWDDIRANRTLQASPAREEADERHICPLQLDVIERALQLWTNKGDLVLSPFAGIGSEGYCAVRMRRRFIGIELKKSYWKVGVKNLDRAVSERDKGTLFQADNHDPVESPSEDVGSDS